MKSVALNESCYHDDDFVVVEADSSKPVACFDLMAGISDVDFDDDDASYDYCDDVFDTSVPSIIEGRSLSFIIDEDLSYCPLSPFDDHTDEQGLLDVASSMMLNEMDLQQDKRHSPTGEIPSARISTTKHDIVSSSSCMRDEKQTQAHALDQDPLSVDSTDANHHQSGSTFFVVDEKSLPTSVNDSRTEVSSVQKLTASVADPTLQVSVSQSNTNQAGEKKAVMTKETLPKQKDANSIRRLTNKKRQKQLKLTRKANTANLAQMTSNSATLPPVRRNIFVTGRSGKKQVAPNLADPCATKSLASYRAGKQIPRHGKLFF